ncbi:SLC13 family permease [Sporomusa malonica]|uniref:Sodium-dependent dicarboxylate transporter SdcS n=1 Tax=Sporomusa malonica TaxID=112901 RepID=A0A1W1ZXI9_9FIRM|nr:DASS family sodium-coupled anion symporter [Sporomusa malonica]SMC53175.1 solute carrier family 13 (sodium-dependent dicarboxylate transporter), member 2/3/5 [Sporomusa malonica]
MQTVKPRKQNLLQAESKLSLEEQQFDFRRKTLGLFLGPALGLLVYFMPIAGLKEQAHGLLAIVTFVATWWITEPVPIPVSSMLGPVIATLMGIVNPTQAFAPFANPLIFLFMGSFMLATAMMSHGLDKRFAYAILSMSWVGSSPTRILLALGLVTALCSGWVSNTATTAMMFPIAMGLLFAIKDMHAAAGREIELSKYTYATGLMLMAGYASSVGGVLTPVGTPPNLIMIGLLEQMGGVRVSFFQWMIWGSIAMVAYFILVYIVLKKMFPADVDHIEGASELIRERRNSLGPWKAGEINAVIAFTVAVTLWVLPGFLAMIYGSGDPILAKYNKYFSEAVVAMLAGLLLFILPTNWAERKFTLTWNEAVKGIDWGTLILFGGGLSLGTMMYTTGLSKWVGDIIVTATGANSQVAIVILFSLFSLLMSELTSHTAATNMVGPLGITVAISAGLSPVPVAVAIALSSSLGFMLPVSTPPNAIVYGSGFIPITKMIKSGFIIDLIGIALVTIPLVVYVVKWVGY